MRARRHYTLTAATTDPGYVPVAGESITHASAARDSAVAGGSVYPSSGLEKRVSFAAILVGRFSKCEWVAARRRGLTLGRTSGSDLGPNVGV